MTEHFDLLVIGAGSAGCVVASRMSENPSLRVGLLDAGDMPVDPDIGNPLKWPALQGRSYDWKYRTVPQVHTAGRVHEWPRGRLVGGSSCLNALAHVRGQRRDFDSWAEAGGPAWSYDGLLPGFVRSESALQVYLPGDEVSPVARCYMAAGNLLGVPVLGNHNSGELLGTAPNALTMRKGRRVSAADAYLSPDVLARRNLVLLTGREAEQLTFARSRVTGAVVGAEGIAITADRTVLCAGAVATPLLLMRSGIGDPAVLAGAGIDCRHDLRGVGANLQDHLLALGNVYRARMPVPPSRLQHSESLMYLDHADWRKTAGRPDIVLACVMAPSVSEQFSAPAYGTAFTILAGVTHPTSRGTIKPSGQGRGHPPLIDPHYLETGHDRAMMREAMKAARRVGASAALDLWREDEIHPGASVTSDADLDRFLARAVCTHHHPAGTCRMGRDELAVVDGALTVRGLEALFVVDASVMPSLPSGPINAAVAAIAETWAAMN